MKKFRNLFMVLALALVCVLAAKAFGKQNGAFGVTTASASGESSESAQPTSNSGSSISGNPTFNVNDATLTVTVTGDKPLYYQIVKKSDGTDIKAANWLPVYQAGGVCKIDLSTYSKSIYVALTFDTSVEKVKTGLARDPFEIAFDKDAKLKGKANFATSLIIDAIDPGYTTTQKAKISDVVKFDSANKPLEDGYYQWRRSVNTAWVDDNAEEGTAALYEAYTMLRSSNGTLYVRSVKDGLYFATKEIKVKIPKGAAAPKIKIDYAKGTIAIPANCEVVASLSGAQTAFVKVGETGITAGSGATTAKVDLKVDTIVPQLGKGAGEDFEFYVRVNATASKYAGYFTKVTDKAPDVAPTGITYTIDSKKKVTLIGADADTSYELSVDGTEWKAVSKFKAASAEVASLKIRVAAVKGKSFASLAGTATLKAEEVAKVKVKLGAAVDATLATVTGLTTEDKEVEKGSTVEFTVVPEDGKEVVVKAGEDVLTAGDGNKYSFKADADTVVTVTEKTE